MSIVISHGDQSSTKSEDILFKLWKCPETLQQALDDLVARGKHEPSLFRAVRMRC
jgi:hypothetical protein